MNIRYYCSAKMRAADRDQRREAAGAATQVPTLDQALFRSRVLRGCSCCDRPHDQHNETARSEVFQRGHGTVPVGTRPGNRACLSIFAQRVFGRVPARLPSAFVLIKSPHVEDWGPYDLQGQAACKASMARGTKFSFTLEGWPSIYWTTTPTACSRVTPRGTQMVPSLRPR